MKTLPKINFLLRALQVLIIIVVSFSKPTLSSAQKAPKIEWQKCFGGSSNEDVNHCGGFVQTSDGGFVLAHNAESNDYDVSGNHFALGTKISNGDAWVFKINSVGAIEWQKCIGGSGTDVPKSIIRTSDNGFALCGFTASNDGDVLGHHSQDNPFYPTDAWVVKLDSIGNIQWSKCYGGSRADYATSIIQTSDGGYAFVGNTNSVDGDVSGNHILIGQGGFPNDTLDDEWVVKLNSSGMMEWQICLGGTMWEHGYSIIEAADGGYVTAGYTSSQEEGFPNYGSNDAYLVKLSKFGSILWQSIIGDKFGDGACSIFQTATGGFIFGGFKNLNGSGNNYAMDIWIVGVDTLGKKLWEKLVGGSAMSYNLSFIRTADSGYALVGTVYGNGRDVSGNHGNNDASVVKLTSSGIFEWQKNLGGSSADNGYNIVQTSDGGYAIDGSTYSNNGDVSGNHSVFSALPDQNQIDVWFVKLKPESNSVENINGGGTHFLNAYPNPASDQIHFQLSVSLTLKQVSFFNVMGNQYFPEYTLENNIATVDMQSLPTGSFVAHIVYQDEKQHYFEQVQKFLHYR